MKRLLVFISVVVALLSCSCGTTKQASSAVADEFSVEAMVQNYNNNSDGIKEVIDYTAQALKDHCGIQLVINKTGISMFYVYNFTWFGIDNPKQDDLDKLMPLVDLSEEELNTIISKLKNINCLSVELMKSGSQFAKVLYWENNKCGYYYHIYYEPLTDTELAEYAKEMDYCIPYSKTMFLEYNPKSQYASSTFPDREQYIKDLKVPIE